MKKWVLVDDMTTKGALLDEEVLPVNSKEEAVWLARTKWEKMSSYDREERDAFFIGFAEYSEEDSMADWDTMTDTADIMKLCKEGGQEDAI